ncbi:hypothetical protein Ab1vBOLIVR5_gp198c [Agrobacterium phage OLIVR5]|uniref:Uncharacterized protein n=1 Tax=Agrobacterium phage OLIVR5 TaxID=2723773 RepID=A0A858MT02_9CAUD|nr:hypothetical protein KNU99_gp203 [Agrobacterium phage OLIVR5]QIW87846.1 hypothetical protein Ab1vBOLIVR5_gp198c [Agrobacterium phage OLIVR5]QIW88111.1 hypothetical protein Ab1vBOLIVR6_gp204c [Agrobacterium phage OLIVR6]
MCLGRNSLNLSEAKLISPWRGFSYLQGLSRRILVEHQNSDGEVEW